MKIYFLLAIFFFSIDIAFTQTINVKVKNSEDERASLSLLEGEKVLLIDSINSIHKGEFQFTLEKHLSGLYRISLSNNKWIIFIYDKEDVVIETDIDNILDSLVILKSESNKTYYNFIKLNNNYKTKTELLQLILARYPKEDDFYQTIKEKLIRVQEDYLYYVNVTSQTNPNSFVARYIRTAQLSVVESNLPNDGQLTYLKTHSLDNVNFYDDGLIYSDAFTNKTIEYLTYYRNPKLPRELLEKEFMIAVDTILTKAKVNSIVYQHIVEYLIDGFRNFGFDQSIDYIVKNYVIKDELCLDAKLESSIDRRIDQARNFKIGNTVPNIIISDSLGNQIELNKINADKTLIIYYASWCPHCQTIVPQVFELYNNQKQKKFEVLAISIDTSRVDWLKYIRDNNLNWYNVSDNNGWDGKASRDYYIYATPSMFLVDEQLKLIAKPSSIEELYNWF